MRANTIDDLHHADGLCNARLERAHGILMPGAQARDPLNAVCNEDRSDD